MRRLGLALALAALPAGGGLAQESARARQAPGPVFRTEVNYIEVDAFVMDDQGEFLRDLTRDDFEIVEEGVPQEITAFAEISIPIERPEETFLEGVASRDTATNERDFGGRVYVFVLDEAHVDARRSGLARDLARQFIEEQMAADDVAAVVIIPGQSGAGQAFTSDKRLLLEAVARFEGRKPTSATVDRLDLIESQAEATISRGREPADAFAPIHGRDLDPSDLERAYNVRRSMETLENVARGLAASRGRRKAILYFSEGIDYEMLDVMRRVQRDASSVQYSVRDAIATATRSGVAVYPIDPRGLISGLGPDDIRMSAPVTPTSGEFQGAQDIAISAETPAGTRIDSLSLDREVRRSLDSLHTLAVETGGFAVVDTNEFEPAYDSIVRANSQYYLMGYYPSDFRRDGEFRKIEVRVRRPGATVVARDGYVRPSGEDEEERPSRAAGDTSPEVRELLDRPWAQSGLTLGVTAAALKRSDEAASVVVTIQLAGRDLPFRQEGDRAVNEIEVSLLAIDHEGRVRGGGRMLAQPRLRPETRERVGRLGMRFMRTLELPPGRYQLRVAAREAEQGKRGSVVYDLQVPDYGDEELVMSGLLVTSRTAPLTLTASTDDQVELPIETPPTVMRTFALDDVVTAYAEVYDELAPAHDFTITARVTRDDGLVVFRSTEERASSELDVDGRLAHEVAIPLADLSPGQYVLQIEAKPLIGEGSATRGFAFDIVAGTGSLAFGDKGAPPWVPPGRDRSRSASRMDRLEAWVEAVELHEPGTGDGPARMVRSWAPEELAQLATDLSLIARLIEYPDYPVLWLTDPERPTRFFRAPYSTDDDERIRAAARDAALRCGQDPSPDRSSLDEEAIRCARNRLLKRGAVLHTDAAINVADETVQPPAGRPDRWRVRFSDGQQRAAEGAPGHWELARSLLANVAPGPEEDDTVRLWYIATSAYGQYYERHTRHEEEAVELFPEDARVLFLAGCLHETFASPTIQSLARSIRVSGSRHGIGPEESELRTAEKLFRRTLEADPAFVEARIRLGRVLHLLDQPRQAALELRQAVATLLSDAGSTADADERFTGDPDDRLMLYLAEMFFGAAAEDLGQWDRARASYARAAELYPGAPSPRLALSQLALRSNDRAAALAAAQQAGQPPGGERDRVDPWWRYHSIQGRDAAVWFDRLHRSLADGS
jgi:VWFA-related protein